MNIMFSGPKQLSNHLSVCHPYGMSITCVCDTQGKVVNCFPTIRTGVKGEEVQERKGGRKGEKSVAMEDNITEILLATTALVAVIAFFVR